MNIPKFGLKTAIEIWRFETECARRVLNIIEDAHGECDVEPVDIFVIEEREKNWLNKWYWKLLNPITKNIFGIEFLLGKDKVNEELSLAKPLENHADAICCRGYTHIFHPRCFGQLLIQQAQDCGADIFAQTRVQKVEEIDGGQLIHTSRGVVKCENVVFATNGWTGLIVPELKDLIVPVRNHVVSTNIGVPRLTKSKHLSAMQWNTESKRYYFMQRAEGDIVCGGFRHPDLWKEAGLGRFEDVEFEAEKLEEANQFFERWEGMENIGISHKWLGILACTMDGIPWCGHLKGNQYVCAGFNGHGMPVTHLCGVSVAKMILNQPVKPFVSQFHPKNKDLEKLYFNLIK